MGSRLGSLGIGKGALIHESEATDPIGWGHVFMGHSLLVNEAKATKFRRIMGLWG